MITRTLLILVLIGMVGLMALLWAILVEWCPAVPELSCVNSDAVLVMFAGSALAAFVCAIFGVFARRKGWILRGLFLGTGALALLRAALTLPLLQG